jgi:electron transfer flavoprotein alpha subunit
MKELAGTSFDVLLPGKGSKNAAAEISTAGADKIFFTEADSLAEYKAESYAPVVAGLAGNGGYTTICSAANAYGKDLMPHVAAVLEAGMASDISDVIKEGDDIVYIRPMFAGNVLGRMKINTDIHVVSVRQTEFPPVETAGSPAQVEEAPGADPEEAAAKIEILAFEKLKSERPELTEAKVVVSGGRGLKNKDNFKMVEELADLLGGAVGATRAVVDAEIAPNDLQVGQTGKIVAPELYFAIGLSGAIQHLAGMKGSKVIVAINKDEEAPIFSVADYGLVQDLFKAVPELIDRIKKLKTQ